MGNTGPLPAAFLSYARMPNEEENDRIKAFRTRLAYEVEILTGRSFSIFLDTSDIQPGQPWPDTIAEKLDSSRLLIALLTPRFFNSQECRKEVEYFLKVEAGLKRRNLIIPIQYVTVPELVKDEGPSNDFVELMKIRQVVDGTLFRSGNFKAMKLRTALSKLATEIASRLREFPETAAVADVSGRRQSGDPEIDKPRAGEIAPTPATLTQSAPVTAPRVRIVDKSKGPYRSVVEALDAAQAGDRILVQPGTYTGALVVDKAIEIVGDGNPEDIVLEAAGVNTLAFRTGFGRVANLTLRQTGRGNFFALDVTQGNLVLEHCRIESAGLAGIAVHGAEADPIIRNNRIRRCAKTGVIVFDHARGRIEENEIAENGAVGVILRDGAAAILRSNQISENEPAGVFADGAAGMLEDNTILGNRGEGVLVANGANPTLRRNRISRNQRAGVYVYDDGAGTITANRIVDNLNSGIAIRARGNPVVRENSVSGNNGKGVWCRDAAAGVVEDNDLRGNAFGSFWKSDDCTTRYTGNQE